MSIKINQYIFKLKFYAVCYLRNIFKLKFGTYFSQFGEDILLNYYMFDILSLKKGNYVDVGCNHPYKFNNTLFLYLKGWNGICIDANSSLIDKFKANRPEDISINAVISDKEEEIKFFEFENDCLSTINDTNKKSAEEISLLKKESKITTTTLQNILDKHTNRDFSFDLLNIDVEGADYQVIQSIDFSKNRPKIILIENSLSSINALDSNEIHIYLTKHDYICFASFCISLLYIDKNFWHKHISQK